jgi:catechol 2,3-dioxygenase-like lactoylglutathione lyase family enzyme
MFEKLALISIPVSDQKAAKAFYMERMGCTLVEEMPFGTPDTMWIRLRLPGLETAIVLATWFKTMRPGSLQGIVLTAKSIEKTHAELAKRGVEISPIERQSYGKEATFADPDGNGWILQQATS